MFKKIGNAFRKIFFYGSIFTALLLVVSNLAGILNPGNWWIVSILGLLFPVLFLLTAFFSITWLFIKPKTSLLFVAAILVSIPSLLKCFAINKPQHFSNKKMPASLRVITWNVGLLNFTAKDHKTAEEQNAKLFDKLKELDADVICLQDFFTSVVPGAPYNFMDSIVKTMGYPYHHFSRADSYFNGQFYSGNIIYSKYKITNTSCVIFTKPGTGGLLKTSLLINKDTINIFTCHLQSVKFEHSEFETIARLKKVSDPSFRGSFNIIKKLKLAFAKRGNQVKLIEDELGKIKGPVVFTGDMNEVPTGYAYHTFTRTMQDVWATTGTGIGRTFMHISPTLRIDYIFVNNHFKSIQTQRIISSASDHYGIVADIMLKKGVE